MSPLHSQLLYSISALALLHFLVAGRLLYLRVRMGVYPEKREELAKHEQNTSNNYKNLFEMPVLFYVIGLLALQLNHVSEGMVVLCWMYVALRYAHSAVHCFYNRIPWRMPLFLGSVLVLGVVWGMVIMGAVK
jgi:hypothetical protein